MGSVSDGVRKNGRHVKKTNKNGDSKTRSQSVSALTNDDSDDNVWDCMKCDQPFSDDDVKMLVCDFCSNTCCTACAKMSDAEYAGMRMCFMLYLE